MRRAGRSRRDILAAGLALSFAGMLGRPTAVGATGLPLTPACGEADEPTPRQTAGPFFTSGSPLKQDLRTGVSSGEPVTLSGFVLSRGCRPVPQALVDLWHADAEGRYDNRGYRLRGHVLTDAEGLYRFETILPGLYPGRTRHYHVRVQAPGGPLLTTQLYLPDEPHNQRDWLFDPALLLELQETAAGRLARFDFVIEA